MYYSLIFPLFENSLLNPDLSLCLNCRGGYPVAVPGVRLADKAATLPTDRCHSLRSLLPPPAALPSLPIAARKDFGTRWAKILKTVRYCGKIRPSRADFTDGRIWNPPLQK